MLAWGGDEMGKIGIGLAFKKGTSFSNPSLLF